MEGLISIEGGVESIEGVVCLQEYRADQIAIGG